MSRELNKKKALAIVAAVVAAISFSGCGGGGGGGGSGGSGALVSVSFLGFFPGPVVTPNVPAVFRDQTLEFTFDGPVDNGILGGFFSQNGTPVEFSGVPPAGSQGIPYYAFVDQNGAHNSLQIRENATGGPLLASYVVGRHKDNPNIIVVDPRVPSNNPLGLPSNQGFKQDQLYVYIIPAGNGFLFGGNSAQPVGPNIFALPLTPPPFTTQPSLSLLFQTGQSFGPDPVPAMVISITSLSGAPGTPQAPIPPADPIIVSFSKIISGASLDPLKNFVIRNMDVTNTTFPGGIIIPGTIAPLTPLAQDDSTYIYTPTSPYGPGPNTTPAEGYDIEVRIGSFGQPATVVPPILGLPTGLSGTQLPISNSLNRIFRTTNCTGCQTPASVVEGFDNTAQKDNTFVQTFSNNAGVNNVPPLQCRWNDASAPGLLAGRVISGSPSGNSTASLGTRSQIIVDPLPNTTPGGLFSPFDSSLANSGGQCPGIPTGCNLGINPGGGCHIMHVYEAAELMNIEDSLEQIEWSPVSGVTAPTMYPNYKIWCGLTSTPSPTGGGTAPGLTAVFDNNYNLTPFQTGIPIPPGCASASAMNPRKVPCGSGIAYMVPLATTTFFAFPRLSPCFDYSTAAGNSGTNVNLLFEQDIDPGNQAPNFNRFRANNFVPVRRLLDVPLVNLMPGLCAANMGGQFDIYKHRFTFVGLVAQCRSLWYDTGVTGPNYLNFILSPPIGNQPTGTESTWILEGTNTSNPQPSTNGNAGIYYNKSGPDGMGNAVPPANATVLTNVIGTLRYFRFKVEVRGNNVNNTIPQFNSAVMAYSF